MAYTVTVKSDQLNQHEGQNSGSDPLKANERGGKVRSAYFAIITTATLNIGEKIGLCVIPSGARVVAVSSYWVRSSASGILTYGTLNVSDGSTENNQLSCATSGTATTSNETLGNALIEVCPTQDQVAIATLSGANVNLGATLRGAVLYVID